MSEYRTDLGDIFFQLFDVLGLDDDGGSLREVLREVDRFAREEAASSFSDRDPETNPLPVLVDGEVKLGDGIKRGWEKYRDSGWDLWGLSERWGGYEIPSAVRWAGIELLVGANPALYFYVSGATMAEVIGREGTPEQWERYGRRIVEDGWGATMVLTEPDAGSDVGAGRTKARRTEGGLWAVEGVKRFITSGDQDQTENIVHLVLARPEGAGPGTKGLSLFLVPKYRISEDGSRGERNGIAVRRIESKLGLKHSATAELGFGEDGESLGELLGEAHDGIRQMFEVIKSARMLIGVKATATASAAHAEAAAYARERIQGRRLGAGGAGDSVVIAEHPDVRRMLMTQRVYAEGLRSLYLYVAHCAEDPERAGRADLLAPVLKAYASEEGFSQVSSALQVLGGSGYVDDYWTEQWLRDARIDPIYEGTTGIQALDLVFRKILRDGGAELSKLWVEIDSWGGAGTVELGEILERAAAHRDRLLGLLGAERGPELVALEAAGFSETLAEVVISWLWCRQLQTIFEAEDGQYEKTWRRGKEVAARWWWALAEAQIAGRAGRDLGASGVLDLEPGEL